MMLFDLIDADHKQFIPGFPRMESIKPMLEEQLVNGQVLAKTQSQLAI